MDLLIVFFVSYIFFGDHFQNIPFALPKTYRIHLYLRNQIAELKMSYIRDRKVSLAEKLIMNSAHIYVTERVH
jgi:hypothetical protein